MEALYFIAFTVAYVSAVFVVGLAVAEGILWLHRRGSR